MLIEFNFPQERDLFDSTVDSHKFRLVLQDLLLALGNTVNYQDISNEDCKIWSSFMDMVAYHISDHGLDKYFYDSKIFRAHHALAGTHKL